MSSAARALRPVAAPDYVPREWSRARNVPLDMLRGLAMVILVVDHLRLESPLQDVTSAVLSAAEGLVAVSGVVVGMVFGRPRQDRRGSRARARTLRGGGRGHGSSYGTLPRAMPRSATQISCSSGSLEMHDASSPPRLAPAWPERRLRRCRGFRIAWSTPSRRLRRCLIDREHGLANLIARPGGQIFPAGETVEHHPDNVDASKLAGYGTRPEVENYGGEDSYWWPSLDTEDAGDIRRPGSRRVPPRSTATTRRTRYVVPRATRARQGGTPPHGARRRDDAASCRRARLQAVAQAEGGGAGGHAVNRRGIGYRLVDRVTDAESSDDRGAVGRRTLSRPPPRTSVLRTGGMGAAARFA